MPPNSPTQRTRKFFSQLNIPTGITEKWNPYARIRQDLFGFIDMVALVDVEHVPALTYAVQGHDVRSPAACILAIQGCSDDGGGVSARVQKVQRSPAARSWCAAGGRIWVMGWGHRNRERADGTIVGARKVYKLRVVEVVLG